MTSFPCTQCGACCRRMGDVIPDMAYPNGHCVHLQADSTCAIYETRPVTCRIDRLIPQGWPVAQWHNVNAGVCNQMQEEDQMSQEYRIRVHLPVVR